LSYSKDIAELRGAKYCISTEGDVDGLLEGDTFIQALSVALMKKYGSTHGTRSQWSSDDDKGNVKHKEDDDDDDGGSGGAGWSL
jgi:hypothetical protein